VRKTKRKREEGEEGGEKKKKERNYRSQKRGFFSTFIAPFPIIKRERRGKKKKRGAALPLHLFECTGRLPAPEPSEVKRVER